MCTGIMRRTFIFVTTMCLTAACDQTMNTQRPRGHNQKSPKQPCGTNWKMDTEKGLRNVGSDKTTPKPF